MKPIEGNKVATLRAMQLTYGIIGIINLNTDLFLVTI